MDPKTPTKTERFDRFVRTSQPVLIIVLALFLITTGGAIVGHARDVKHWWDGRDWRAHEYDKLAQLHSDLTVATFERVLGPPLVERRDYDRPTWTIRIFGGRDYWVAAASRKASDSVEMYAVTTCSPSFNPTYRLGDGASITLQRSTLADARSQASAFRFWIGASVGSRFFLSTIPSHPSNFKGFAWGNGGSCREIPPTPPGKQFGPPGSVPAAQMPASFAKLVVVNTYAEWGPTIYEWPSTASIGVSEIDINVIAGKCVVGCVGYVEGG
jgi:hypothetical protein